MAKQIYTIHWRWRQSGGGEATADSSAVCSRNGGETGDLDLEEMMWGRSEVRLLVSMAKVICGFLGNACWNWDKAMGYGKFGGGRSV